MRTVLPSCRPQDALPLTRTAAPACVHSRPRTPLGIRTSSTNAPHALAENVSTAPAGSLESRTRMDSMDHPDRPHRHRPARRAGRHRGAAALAAAANRRKIPQPVQVPARRQPGAPSRKACFRSRPIVGMRILVNTFETAPDRWTGARSSGPRSPAGTASRPGGTVRHDRPALFDRVAGPPRQGAVTTRGKESHPSPVARLPRCASRGDGFLGAWRGPVPGGSRQVRRRLCRDACQDLRRCHSSASN